MTKRGLLQLIARVFDPLGLLSPLFVCLKCAFQYVCKSGIGWDDSLPDEQLVTVQEWLKDLSKVGTIRFPRYCFASALSEVQNVK